MANYVHTEDKSFLTSFENFKEKQRTAFFFKLKDDGYVPHFKMNIISLCSSRTGKPTRKQE